MDDLAKYHRTEFREYPTKKKPVTKNSKWKTNTVLPHPKTGFVTLDPFPTQKYAF